MKRLFLVAAALAVITGSCKPDSSPSETAGGGTAAALQAVTVATATVDGDTLQPTLLGADGYAAGALQGSSTVSQDGSARYSIPLWMPTGRAGLRPQASLTYNSQSGSGIAGLGWELGGLSRVTRCHRTVAQDGFSDAPRGDASDAFCLDGQRLVVIAGTHGVLGSEYRTERDAFARVHLVGGELGSESSAFRVRRRDGTTWTYGGQNNASWKGRRVMGEPQVFSWALSRVEDASGNWMSFHYDVDASRSEQVLSEIRYTGSSTAGLNPMRRVVFGYTTNRPARDVRQLYSAAFGDFPIELRKRLAWIEVRGPGATGTEQLLRRYVLRHQEDASTGRSLLESVQECDGAGACREPTRFGYSVAPAWFESSRELLQDSGLPLPLNSGLLSADLDGDGNDDLINQRKASDGTRTWQSRRYRLFSAQGTGFKSQSVLTGLPPVGNGSLLNSDARFVDLTGDGLADFVGSRSATNSSGQSVRELHVRVNLGPGGFVSTTVLTEPGATRRPFWTLDLNGDGLPDLVRTTGASLSPSSSTKVYELTAHLNSPTGLGPASSIFPAVLVKAGMPGFPVDLDGSGRAALLLPKATLAPDGTVAFTGDTYWALRLSRAGQFEFTDSGVQREDVSGRRNVFLDINGDGLLDLVTFPKAGGDLTLSLNVGGRFGAATAAQLPMWAYAGAAEVETPPNDEGFGGSRHFQDNGLRVADFNNDGRQDILLLDRSWGRTQAVAVYSTGQGFSAEALPFVAGEGSTELGYVSAHTLDVDGDSLTDAAQVEGYHYVTYRRGGPRAGLLTSVVDGEGATAGFTYASTSSFLGNYLKGSGCAYPQRCLQPRMWVVFSHETLPGPGTHARRLSYRYGDARVDQAGLGWLGFGWRHQEEQFTDDTVGSYYELVEEQYDNSTRVSSVYPFSGMLLKRVRRVNLEGTLARFFELTQTPDLRETPALEGRRYFGVFIRQTREREYDADTATAPPTERPALRDITRTVEDFNAEFGNVERVVERWTTGHTTVRVTAYENHAHLWLVGLPTRESVTSTTPAGLSATRVTSWRNDPATGRVLEAVEEPDSADADVRLSTSYEYTPEGLVRRVVQRDLKGALRERSWEFDALTRTYHVAQTDGVGQRTQLAYHPGLDVLAATVDPNGVHVIRRYDGFGRMTQELGLRANAGAVALLDNVSIDYLPGQRRSSRAQSATRSKRENLFSDGWGRPLRRVTLDFAGSEVQETYLYDALGRLQRKESPSAAGGKAVTTYAYDALGRLMRLTHPDGTFRTYTHDGLLHSTTDERSITSSIEKDALGQLVTKTEVNPAGGTLATRFVHGPFGRLQRVTDAGGARHGAAVRRARPADPPEQPRHGGRRDALQRLWRAARGGGCSRGADPLPA